MPVDDVEEQEPEAVEPEEDRQLPGPDTSTLGLYAPFDVSDQVEWTKQKLDEERGGKLRLAENLRSMVVAACQRETLARRLEVGRAQWLELIDRGFHRLIPLKGGGFSIAGSGMRDGMDVFGFSAANQLYDIGIIGAHNDIIVNALTRDLPKTEFTARTDSDKASTAAAAANKLKYFIQQDANFKQGATMAARLYCTDERVAWYMRPVADAQRFGYEDDGPDIVPENEEAVPAGGSSKKPRIQMVLDVFGKLEHKGRIAGDNEENSPYQIIATEEDTAQLRAELPWIAKEIKGGSSGIGELELDRVLRESIKLAIRGKLTGQGQINDTTRLRCWLTPAFYWDDSCSEDARDWFLATFPKGCLAVYAGTELGFVRNESWKEVLTISHARTGKGQNRRALTEAYAGPNMILDNLFDLLVKFFTSTVPRVFYDDMVFNISQLRKSGNIPGKKEGFNSSKVTANVAPILQDPMPTHQAALPDTIQWLAGPLAQTLTGAQLTLMGAQQEDGEQGTLGEAKMDNDSALTRLSEPWAASCKVWSNVTKQAVEWTARVCSGKIFDRIIPSQGRLRVEMKDIDSNLLSVAETDTNFPESWSEREEKVWQLIQQMPTNAFIATIMGSPANARVIQDAARMGITIPAAESWEKQEGEFTLLLEGKPQPNPQIVQAQQQIQKLALELEKGTGTIKQEMAQGQQPADGADAALQQIQTQIQQLQQVMQSLPPLVSSVPIRADGSEEDGIEAMCCLQKMISAEGRRMAHSENANERNGFANLHLHWAEHNTAAKDQAKKNQQPVEPKVSITAALDKMPPQWQATMLSKMDVSVDPQQAEEMGPHEVTHEVKGVNAQGAEESVKTSLVGKSLQ